MPYREWGDERYWCPGPWPWEWFDTCTRRVQKWCYNFDFYKEYQWGPGTQVEACEGKIKYSWWEWGLGFGSNTYYNVKMCYKTTRSQDGSCEENIGVNLGAFTPSDEPFVSRPKVECSSLEPTTAETGTFEFTLENSKNPCRRGSWPYKIVLHPQVITATVSSRLVQIQWVIGGVPITNSSGQVLIAALCRWPTPLPSGRSEIRIVQLRYEVDTTVPGVNTIKIYNNPTDGTYLFSLGMLATKDGQNYYSFQEDEIFEGETCDFEPEQLDRERKCMDRFKDTSGHPKPWDPVINLLDAILSILPDEKRENVRQLLDLLKDAYGRDPEAVIWITGRLEEEIGLAGASRLLQITPPQAWNESQKVPSSSSGILFSAVGGALLGGLIGYLVGRRRNSLR